MDFSVRHGPADVCVRAAGGVFALVVVEGVGGRNFCHRQGFVAQDGDCEFAAGDEFFHQRMRAETPVAGDFVAAVGALVKDFDPHGGTFVEGL